MEFSAASACRGHRAAVTCLEARQEQALFASGSEDKTVRVWDVRASPVRAQTCICNCFPTSVDSLAFGPKDENLLYASSGNQVFVFDLRSSSEVLLKTPLAVVKPYGDEDSGDNEINALKIHPKGGHMALGDDEGSVLVLEMGTPRNPSTWRVSRRLSRGVHSSIVGAVAFKPNSVRDLASGGFDCVVGSWDFALGRSLKSYNFGTAAAAAAAAAAAGAGAGAMQQMFNPPCVHALAYACSGRVLLAALGDGSLRAMAVPSLAPLLAREEAHNAMASSLCVVSAPAPAAVLAAAAEAAARRAALAEATASAAAAAAAAGSVLGPAVSSAEGDESSAVSLGAGAGAGAGTRAAGIAAGAGAGAGMGVGVGVAAEVALTAGVDGMVRGWAVFESGQGQSRELHVDALFTIAHGRKINAVAGLGTATATAATVGSLALTLTTVVVADTTGTICLYHHHNP